MTVRWRGGLISLLGLLGCVPQIASRTIVPDRTGEDRGADAGRPLPRLPSLAGMAGVHIGESWWPFRARFLKLTERQAQERDAAISDKLPPDRFWDEQTALESLNLWTAVCTECHGGRRRPEDVDFGAPPPAGWGKGEAVFFGSSRPYARIFGVVHGGGPEREGKASTMPAWKGTIAREQIWALVYFLEQQSSEAVDAPLPPSLPPRLK
jgi:hypothetical protein